MSMDGKEIELLQDIARCLKLLTDATDVIKQNSESILKVLESIDEKTPSAPPGER
jgi:hypothetical protein